MCTFSLVTITNDDLNKGYLIIKGSEVKELLQCNDGHPQVVVKTDECIGSSKLFFYKFNEKLPSEPEGNYIGHVRQFGRNNYYAVYLKSCCCNKT